MSIRFDKATGAMIVQHESLTVVLQEFTVAQLIAAINAVFSAGQRATIAAGI